VTPEDIHLSIEDPRDEAGATLIAEMKAFIAGLYPEDGDEPAPPWTVEDLALRGLFILARADGLPVGCGALAPMDVDGALEIVRMYVRPDYRGRRIADRVLADLERSATARGVRVLMLRCGPRQPGALKVYERNGYRRRGVFAHHRDHPTNLFYEKTLAADGVRDGLPRQVR
jgi:putative acetyltransferase